MAEKRVKRKLTAILSADVKGYSRLMGEDELATVETLKQYRKIIGRLVMDCHGRVVDSPGDNILAEFSSVVDALECAVKIQEEIKEKNINLPENRRMEFRIGINLGDVIEEEGRIYGDGVNIAARLEGLAEVGGICISGTAFDQVKNKLSVGYQYLGKQTVKNIPDPVRAYKVLMEPEAVGKVIGEAEPKPRKWGWKPIAAVVLLILVAGGLIWNIYWRAPRIEPASVERMAFPLPAKPSIAVLPFDNLSGDPGQEYIADGISENIITSLSQISEIFVIAKNSTFVYKNKPVKVQKVAEELGVGHVLEGSVQCSGDRIRVTAQLIDATKGHHLWSERYDRNMKDFFALQDEITKEIVVSLQVKLTLGEQGRIWHRDTNSLEAWSYCVKGYSLFERFTKPANEKARDLFIQAMRLDPEYAMPQIMIGWTHWIDARFGFSKNSSESLGKSLEIAKKALVLDESHPNIHSLLGAIYLFQRKYDQALSEGKKAIELGPSNSEVHALLAMSVHYAGDFESAIKLFKKAMRLSPYYPSWYLYQLGESYLMSARYGEAISTWKQHIERAQREGHYSSQGHLGLAAAYYQIGNEEASRKIVEEFISLTPKFSLERYRTFLLFRNEENKDSFLALLRKAGLPETPPLPLPDKPSIAVLPFTNMSDDPQQEYFSDGITEEIITALSKVPDLSVIARNSSFTYKGKSVSIPVVGRELGVRYVLEGSVRKASNKVRVTAQLIDAQTNNHLWAERYDRDLEDIFALQDEITMKILTAVRVELTEGEQARLYGKRARNLDSFMKVLEGRPYFYRFSRESNLQARQMFAEAIALEPENAHAFTMLGWTYLMEVWFGSSESPSKAVDRVVELAQNALSLDDTIDSPHSLLAHVYLLKRQFEMAIAEAERAVALSPNGADAQAHLGMILNYAGRREAAIASLKKAMRLNPIPPNWYLFSLGEAYCFAGEHEEALAAYEQVLRGYPEDIRALIGSTAIYSLLGRKEEARAQAAQILTMEPKFSLESFVKTLPFKNKADAELLFDSLHKAGLK
jgi:adenylate cyclase